jgi:ankyrin repeat protein
MPDEPGVKTLLKAGYNVHSMHYDKSGALHWAARQGHADAIKYLLAHGVDVDAKDSNDQTALFHAVDHGHAAAVGALMDAHPTMFVTYHAGHTPLHLAASRGHVDVVRVLLAKMDDASLKGDNKYWAGVKALRYSHEEIAQLIVKAMEDKELTDALKQRFLEQASLHGSLMVVQLLLEKGAKLKGDELLHVAIRGGGKERGKLIPLLLSHGADIEARDEKGRTPLITAAFWGTKDIAQILVDSGANVAAKDQEGQTALHLTASHGLVERASKTESVDLMQLFRGSDLESTDDDGRTPLIHAAKAGNVETVRQLIDKKANIMATDKNDWSAVHHAAKGDHADVLPLFQGADLEAKEKKEGWTPLMVAAEAGNTKAVRTLIDMKVNIMTVEAVGFTALQLAASSGHGEVVQLMIDMGASFQTKGYLGESPLHTAARRGRDDVVRVLVEAGAPLETGDDRGRTPLMLAAEYGRNEAASILLSHQADIAATTDLKYTALHYAAVYAHKSTTKLLVERGADPKALNTKGQTPQEFAAAHDEVLDSQLFEKPQDASTEYIYTVLDSPRQIRILIVQPGEFEDPVHCDLKIVSLDSAEFEALSYLWGNELADKEITISGGKFKIRDSVLSALLRFRKPLEPRPLWIDAICINQQDISERNQQVSLMTEIYSRASEVLIWFGKDDTLAPAATAEITAYIYNMQDEDSADYCPTWNPNTTMFLSNPWFHRAWIFQEVVCSKKATIYCGIRDKHDKKNIYFRDRAINAISWDKVSKFYSLVGETRMLQRVPTGFCTVIGPIQYSQSEYNAKDGTKRHLDLLALLEIRRDGMATDPRDKVFSHLGLSIEGQNGTLQADYRSPVGEVYTNVAAALIRSRKDLRVLSAVQARRIENKTLPSWVPDWEEPWHVRSLVQQAVRPEPSAMSAERFSATAGRPLEIELDENPHHLKLKGSRFDRIKVIADFTSDVLAHTSINHLQQMGFPFEATYPVTKTSYLVALCKTVVGDLFFADPLEESLEKPTYADLIRFTKMR